MPMYSSAARSDSKLRSPDSKALSDLLKVLSEDLAPSGLSTTDSVQTPEELLPIDKDIHRNPSFDISTVGERSAQFQSWQFEILLDQTADLLERLLRDKAAYDSLRAQWLKLRLDSLEFERLRLIHEQEIAAGFYDVDSIQSRADSIAEQKGQDAAKQIVADIDALLNSPLSDTTRLAKQAGLLAKISSYAAYQGQHAVGMSPAAPNKMTVNGVTVTYFDSGFNHTGETMLGPNGEAPSDGQPNGTAKSELVRALVTDQTKKTLGREVANLQTQKNSYQGQLDASSARLIGRAARADYDEKNQGFRRSRDEVAVEMNDLKRLAMRTPGGAYNLREQMEGIRERFVNDFRDAHSRIIAAYGGLSGVLGYSKPVPAIPDSKQPYSDCLVWVREAIKHVVAFGQRDQSYILPLSLRQLVGDEQWKKIRHEDKHKPASPLSVAFSLDESKFAGQAFVRLRGVSMSLFGHDVAGDYQCTIRPPRQAAIRRTSAGNTRTAELMPLDQTKVPPIRYGRARLQNPLREPDVAGTNTFRNVSPIGLPSASTEDRSWQIEIDPKSTAGRGAEKIEDIQLNLYLAVVLS